MDPPDNAENERRIASLVTDATLVLALVTAAVYAGGYAYHDAYYGHWLLPPGSPSGDTTTLLQQGFQAGAVASFLFLVWLGAATDWVPAESESGRSALRRKVWETSSVWPTGLFAFIMTFLFRDAWRSGKASAWVSAVIAGGMAVIFGVVAVWFFRHVVRREGILGHSRGADAVVVLLVAFGLLTASYVHGGYMGDARGEIDASGDRSTLPRVSFNFTDEGWDSENMRWRLLSHVDGTFYVFSFAHGDAVQGRPLVTLIPDSAVRQARLSPP